MQIGVNFHFAPVFTFKSVFLRDAFCFSAAFWLSAVPLQKGDLDPCAQGAVCTKLTLSKFNYTVRTATIAKNTASASNCNIPVCTKLTLIKFGLMVHYTHHTRVKSVPASFKSSIFLRDIPVATILESRYSPDE